MQVSLFHCSNLHLGTLCNVDIPMNLADDMSRPQPQHPYPKGNITTRRLKQTSYTLSRWYSISVTYNHGFQKRPIPPKRPHNGKPHPPLPSHRGRLRPHLLAQPRQPSYILPFALRRPRPSIFSRRHSRVQYRRCVPRQIRTCFVTCTPLPIRFQDGHIPRRKLPM